MATGSATIGGEVILASSDVRWRLREGVKPVVEAFDVMPASKGRLLSGPLHPVDLVIRGPSGELTVSDLYVIGELPSEDPNIARVEVADRRWFWDRPHVNRRYNIRRNVGVMRLANPGTKELQPVVEDVWYAPWSLKDEKPWTATEVLRDVLEEVLLHEREFVHGPEKAKGAGVNVVIADEFDDIPIENFELEDDGDQAIRRVLSYLPEAAITVDPNGTVRIYSRLSGREGAPIREGGPETRDGGHVQLVTRERIRPREVHVLFGRLVELRFDSEESDHPTATEDQRYAENVLPVPDFELTVGGAPVAQGTWIPFHAVLDAWGEAPGLGKITFDLIQKALVPFMDLWSGVLLAGALDPDADWMGRVSAINDHYRRTFRINRRWMDRILTLEPYRVAIVDPETGQRAPAMAWSDYARIPTQRALIAQAAGGKDLAWALNVEGYPPGGKIDKDSKPAPADVSVADPDQGILHVAYLTDPYRMTEMVLPSKVSMSDAPDRPGPTGDITDRGSPITFDTVSDSSGVPKLAANHKIAILLTAVPASPNSDRQLERIVVTPKDVAPLFSKMPGALAGLSNATGPVVEVRVPTSIEAARVAWSDEEKDVAEIERAFGIGAGEPQLRDLIVNYDSNGRGASLVDVAKAVAARVWARFADREQGGKTVPLKPGLLPDGWIREVVHSIRRTGQVTTELVLRDDAPQLNLFALMDSGTRRQVLKTARPGKGA